MHGLGAVRRGRIDRVGHQLELDRRAVRRAVHLGVHRDHEVHRLAVAIVLGRRAQVDGVAECGDAGTARIQGRGIRELEKAINDHRNDLLSAGPD